MAKFTLEEIMYGEKYSIESDVFMAAYELAKQGIKPADIRKQLRMLYVFNTVVLLNQKTLLSTWQNQTLTVL